MTCVFCLTESASSCCHFCLALIDDLRWTGCPRCGTNSCLGCNNLSEFSSVDSIYKLTEESNNLIMQAKDSMNQKAQYQLEVLAKLGLEKQLNQYGEKPIFITSPLRKERLISTSWHPIFLFKDAIIEAYKKDFFSCFNILSPIFLESRKKRTYLNAEERKDISQDKIEAEMNSLFCYEAEILKTAKDIIFCDDVLTHGETAKTVYLFIKKLCPSETRIHILTLFRSPQKQNIDK